MNPHAGFHVYLVADADSAQVGLWCDVCQLPSKIKFPVYSLTTEGVGYAGDMATCIECEGEEDEDDEGEGTQPADLVRG